MMSRTHITGGLGIGYTIFNNIDLLNVNLHDDKTFLLVTAGLVFGSLIPDIDHPKSKFSLSNKAISFIPSRLLKHRGFTHSILGAITITGLSKLALALSGVSSVNQAILTKSIFIGILTHIFLDMLTPSGICLFSPSNKRVSIGSIKTKSLGEYVIFIMLSILFYRNLFMAI